MIWRGKYDFKTEGNQNRVNEFYVTHHFFFPPNLRRKWKGNGFEKKLTKLFIHFSIVSHNNMEIIVIYSSSFFFSIFFTIYKGDQISSMISIFSILPFFFISTRRTNKNKKIQLKWFFFFLYEKILNGTCQVLIYFFLEVK